jgi:DNA-binding transcriptional regulator GbsR (MarR family)
MQETDLIEKFGLSFEQDGLPRIAGRIVGFMILRGGPFTLDELSDQLQISKTSASTNTRLLETLGLLTHTAKPGDRRDYYQLASEYGERIFAMASQRIKKMHDLLAEAAEALPAAGEGGRDRLRNMQQFYEFLLTDIAGCVNRWETYRKDK